MPRDIKKSKIEYLQKNTICNNSIFVFMKKAVKMLKRDKREGFVPFMIMLYLLISSFAETSFFNPTSMLLFLIFAYIEVNAAKRERFRPI